jgi:hypothetical protein
LRFNKVATDFARRASKTWRYVSQPFQGLTSPSDPRAKKTSPQTQPPLPVATLLFRSIYLPPHHASQNSDFHRSYSCTKLLKVYREPYDSVPAQMPAQSSLGQARTRTRLQNSTNRWPPHAPATNVRALLGQRARLDALELEGSHVGGKSSREFGGAATPLPHPSDIPDIWVVSVIRRKMVSEIQHHGTYEIAPCPEPKSCIDQNRKMTLRMPLRSELGICGWRYISSG